MVLVHGPVWNDGHGQGGQRIDQHIAVVVGRHGCNFRELIVIVAAAAQTAISHFMLAKSGELDIDENDGRWWLAQAGTENRPGATASTVSNQSALILGDNWSRTKVVNCTLYIKIALSVYVQTEVFIRQFYKECGKICMQQSQRNLAQELLPHLAHIS